MSEGEMKNEKGTVCFSASGCFDSGYSSTGDGKGSG